MQSVVWRGVFVLSGLCWGSAHGGGATAQEPVALAPEPVSEAAFAFHEVGARRGLTPFEVPPGMAAGLAAADYDDDGDVDLFLPTGGGREDRLYRNDGGTFTDVAPAVGLASTIDNRGALWLDVDGDHDLDLFRANDQPGVASSFLLHRQLTAGAFVDVTASAGLVRVVEQPGASHYGGACAGDLDNDGRLELLATVWKGGSYLFWNVGNGRFVERAAESGMLIDPKPWQPMMVDIDEDGWLDVYVAVDFTENHLWVNQQDGTFVDVAEEARVDYLMNDMGLTIVDYDDDGDFDFYTTNVFDLGGSPGYNLLLRNDSGPGGPLFTDVSMREGVAHGGWGWGIAPLDADRDGVLEIAATNGFDGRTDTSRLFRRRSITQPFQEIAHGTGFADSYWGSCLLAFDYDRDGDEDVFQTCLEGLVRLLENEQLSPGRHYLVVRPRMNGPNHRAIGATVSVTVGGRTMRRLISAGTSLAGQAPAEAFFGLGHATLVQEVRVDFPDGTAAVLTDVSADQVLDVY